SPRLQERVARLAADVSFAKTAEHLVSVWDVALATETVRTSCRRKAAAVARWQTTGAGSAKTFEAADRQWEFAVDAGKVHTRERGWRDSGSPWSRSAPQVLPSASARVRWADIAASKRFRRNWRPRLKRLGLGAMANLQVLGDGASWVWKSADRVQTHD